jgi:hypothetical protein
MRLPNSAHEAHPWVIGRFAPDFRLLDAWAVPAEGGPDDFDLFLEVMASFDPTNAESALSRALFSLRLRLGAWLGLDDATKKRPIPGCTETTLSARLPEGLRGTATGPVVGDALHKPGSSPCIAPATSGPPRSPMPPCTEFCCSHGWSRRTVVFEGSWASTSSRVARSGRPTRGSSNPFATSSSTRHSCARSNVRGLPDRR